MADRRTIHYFQWLRALGAVAIVVLHAFITVNVALGRTVGLVDGMLMIVCGRWAVPVFFMMSGALMLDPDREMGWPKMLRHVWRLGFVLLTFGYAFCLAEEFVGSGSLSPQVFSRAAVALATQRSWDHLWFVYQLLGFYLVTPLIRPWVAQASREELRRVTLVACVLLLGLKALSSQVHGSDLYYGFAVPHCFAYYLMGLYVHRYLRLEPRWVALGLVSLAATFVLWYVLGQGWATDPNRGVVAPFALLVLLLVRRYLDVPIERHRLMALLADYSFGIYLVHPAFQHLLALAPDLMALPQLLAVLVMALLSLALSVVAVWALRLIPPFRDKL